MTAPDDNVLVLVEELNELLCDLRTRIVLRNYRDAAAALKRRRDGEMTLDVTALHRHEGYLRMFNALQIADERQSILLAETMALARKIIDQGSRPTIAAAAKVMAMLEEGLA